LYVKDVWIEVVRQLTERNLAKDWVHGVSHIERVQKNLETLLKLGLREKISEEMERCLKIAVDVHDIGRGLPGDHAIISAKIFFEMEIDDLTPEEKENIHFAVRNHNIGLVGIGINKIKEDREILLGILSLVDHMDALGEIGFFRTIEATRLPLLSNEYTTDKLENFIYDPERVGIDMKSMKDESVLAHIIYNYCATKHIIEPVYQLLYPGSISAIFKRMEELHRIIKDLLRVQKTIEK